MRRESLLLAGRKLVAPIMLLMHGDGLDVFRLAALDMTYCVTQGRDSSRVHRGERSGDSVP